MKNVIARMLEIKAENKKRFAAYMQEKCGVKINPQSVFDIQVKRLHEYKHQQMNALYVIYKYLRLRPEIFRILRLRLFSVRRRQKHIRLQKILFT